jgi:hypothetical protein
MRSASGGKDGQVTERLAERGVIHTFGLVNKVQEVGIVGGFERADIVVLGALEDLGQTGEVDAQRHGTITSIVDEEFVGQVDRDQGDVRVVHGLEADAFLGALEVGIGYELLGRCRG